MKERRERGEKGEEEEKERDDGRNDESKVQIKEDGSEKRKEIIGMERRRRKRRKRRKR